MRCKGQLCWVRSDAGEQIDRIALCRGELFSVGTTTVGLKEQADYVEIRFDESQPMVVAGQKEDVEFVERNGLNVWGR